MRFIQYRAKIVSAELRHLMLNLYSYINFDVSKRRFVEQRTCFNVSLETNVLQLYKSLFREEIEKLNIATLSFFMQDVRRFDKDLLLRDRWYCLSPAGGSCGAKGNR